MRMRVSAALAAAAPLPLPRLARWGSGRALRPRMRRHLAWRAQRTQRQRSAATQALESNLRSARLRALLTPCRCRRSSQLVDLAVDGVPVRRYLTAFQWNEAKHPARRPLRETVDKLAEGVAQLEDELKLKVADYNTSKSALGQLTRKAGGSLATRDLGDIVAAAPPGCLVESEQLTTLLVAVPAHAAKEWRGCYEKLAQYVVPRSSRTLKEEADYCLVSVTLFRRTVDAFKTAARDR
jgi:hypothetical protein